MAVDESIFYSCTHDEMPPTLRLYGWSKPAVSVGYLQKLDAERFDLEYCRTKGVEIVRRLTGGRAVLHGHDLTFSIALGGVDIPSESRGVRGSHQWLMSGIVTGLGLLGIQSEIGGQGTSDRPKTGDCFDHIADCDVRMRDVKVVGAAQVRRWGGLLEQGSIPMHAPMIDSSLIFRNDESSSKFQAFHQLSEIELRSSIAKGFETALGVSFELSNITPSDITPSELSYAEEIERTRYSSNEWNFRL